jgi:integrase
MKRALTAKAIEAIKPPKAGQIEVFDQGYPGLALRVSYGGAKSFTTYYRPGGGKHRRITLGLWPAMSLAEAREAWRRVREEVVKGGDPAREKQGRKPGMSFDVVIEEWLRRDQSKNKASSQYRVGRLVEHDLLPAWTGRRVDDLTKRDVLDLTDSIMDRGATVQARRVHSHVQRFFNWCVERNIIKANPMTGLKRPGSETSRDRVLTDAEVVKVWTGTEGADPFNAITRLLLLTGCRLQEIGSLKWSEIDGNLIKLRGERTKNNLPNEVHLTAVARAILEEQPRIEGSDFVFTLDGQKPVSGWSRAKKRIDASTGVTGWRLHDIRRTVSTGMNELGVDSHIVEAVLGHKVKGVAGVYNKAKHEAASYTALQAWGAHVIALVEGRKPGKVLFYAQTRLK